MTSLSIGSGVTSLYSSMFSGCTGLTSIVISPDNSAYDSRNNCNAVIETASNRLVKGCKKTVIPDGIAIIGDYAFYNCKGLKNIVLPGSLTSIEEYAFYGCSGLTGVILPEQCDNH